MLVPTIVTQFSSGADLRLLKEFPLYCRLWDFGIPILGRIFRLPRVSASTLRARPHPRPAMPLSALMMTTPAAAHNETLRGNT